MPTYHAGSTEISRADRSVGREVSRSAARRRVTIDVLVALPKDNDGPTWSNCTAASATPRSP